MAYRRRSTVKIWPDKTISIGFNIFITTLAVVFLAVLLAGMVSMMVFSGTLNSLVASQSREINKQIVMNFETYINSVIETANFIELGSFNIDISTDTGVLNELYLLNTNLKKDVVAIFLFDKTGSKLLGPILDISQLHNVSDRDWFQSALGIGEIFHFNGWQVSSLADNREEQVIPVSKAFEYLDGGQLERGVLLIELNNAVLTELAYKTNLGASGHLLIIDEQGNLLYSSEPKPYQRSESSLAIAGQLYLGGRRAIIEGLDMSVNVNTLGQTRWRIVTVSNSNEINAALKRLILILLLVLAAIIALSAFFSALISLRLSRPVNQLKSAMLKVEEGNFSSPIQVSGQKEIASLAHSFNSMIEKVQELMNNLVEEQQDKRKTELRALQNQINPHFLYNTLDSIVWLAEHQRNSDVISTVVSLARFFRISISKGEIFITVDEEIEHVQNYLNIQSIRYVNKFTYSFDIPEDLHSRKVMKLILQPLVENAIYHGVGDDNGHISISARADAACIIFDVSNTGYGISEEKIKEMYAIMQGSAERSSIGIRNVYQRLKLYYGENADIIISSVPDESTTISLLIPDVPEEL